MQGCSTSIISNRSTIATDTRRETKSSGSILLVGGHATINGGTLPDGTRFGTTFQNNQRNAVTALENSQFRSNGATKFLNNGSLSVEFHAGISATHSSVVAVTGGEITGSVGPGISADSSSTIRLSETVVSGSTEEGVRLLHGAVFESLAGTNVPANGDATAIVFGDFAAIAPFECAKKNK